MKFGAAIAAGLGSLAAAALGSQQELADSNKLLRLRSGGSAFRYGSGTGGDGWRRDKGIRAHVRKKQTQERRRRRAKR